MIKISFSLQARKKKTSCTKYNAETGWNAGNPFVADLSYMSPSLNSLSTHLLSAEIRPAMVDSISGSSAWPASSKKMCVKWPCGTPNAYSCMCVRP